MANVCGFFSLLSFFFFFPSLLSPQTYPPPLKQDQKDSPVILSVLSISYHEWDISFDRGEGEDNVCPPLPFGSSLPGPLEMKQITSRARSTSAFFLNVSCRRMRWKERGLFFFFLSLFPSPFFTASRWRKRIGRAPKPPLLPPLPPLWLFMM